MKLSLTKAFKQAVSIGIIAGMRSMYAPAIVSHMYSRHTSNGLKNSPLKFMQAIPTSKVFKVLAVGELVGDKLPNAPNRTDAPGLIGRILSGALCGAAIYKGNNANVIVGGLIGSTAAVASTFGCYFLRTTVTKNTILPDTLVGAIEDALVIGSGIGVTRIT